MGFLDFLFGFLFLFFLFRFIFFFFVSFYEQFSNLWILFKSTNFFPNSGIFLACELFPFSWTFSLEFFSNFHKKIKFHELFFKFVNVFQVSWPFSYKVFSNSWAFLKFHEFFFNFFWIVFHIFELFQILWIFLNSWTFQIPDFIKKIKNFFSNSQTIFPFYELFKICDYFFNFLWTLFRFMFFFTFMNFFKSQRSASQPVRAGERTTALKKVSSDR